MEKTLKVVTPYVLSDEPCYGLFEGSMQVPQWNGATEERWIQDVVVIRNDRKAHYITDFGPANEFEHITPMMIPSFGENTVAQLQDLAERNRHDDYWYKRSQEMMASSTLIADHIRQVEEQHELIRNRSHFGSIIAVQRNGYSHLNVERMIRAKRRA